MPDNYRSPPITKYLRILAEKSSQKIPRKWHHHATTDPPTDQLTSNICKFWPKNLHGKSHANDITLGPGALHPTTPLPRTRSSVL
ncbi:MAG: hypothetical protein BJ554DRAFT_3105 [Olpidium bornovanus]|uniref:Uncharacterized protein n=1 Tax=Olpidium bornovanus TaxID=278681 RepID=A0A8H8DG39_9FUNG|nr:MAG: hypothetical protein BJ554DRAFT_3105 [Olpidium bornovanus]